MKRAHRDRKPNRFKRPQSVVRVAIDPETGLLPYQEQEDAVEEVFVKGTEPTELAPKPEMGEGGAGGGGPLVGGHGSSTSGVGGAGGRRRPHAGNAASEGGKGAAAVASDAGVRQDEVPPELPEETPPPF